MLSEVVLDVEICEKVQHGEQIQPTPDAESVVDYPRSHVNQSNDELKNLKFYYPFLPLWAAPSGSEAIGSVEHYVDEGVEHEADGKVGVGVLAVQGTSKKPFPGCVNKGCKTGRPKLLPNGLPAVPAISHCKLLKI